MPTHDLALHAVLTKADVRANRKGVKTYKIAFSYPPGFHAVLGDVVGTEVDIYWNEQVVAHSAYVTGATVKGVKDEDNEYIISFDATPQDTALANLGNQVNESGDLRLHALQLAIGLSD